MKCQPSASSNLGQVLQEARRQRRYKDKPALKKECQVASPSKVLGTFWRELKEIEKIVKELHEKQSGTFKEKDLLNLLLSVEFMGILGNEVVKKFKPMSTIMQRQQKLGATIPVEKAGAQYKQNLKTLSNVDCLSYQESEPSLGLESNMDETRSFFEERCRQLQLEVNGLQSTMMGFKQNLDKTYSRMEKLQDISTESTRLQEQLSSAIQEKSCIQQQLDRCQEQLESATRAFDTLKSFIFLTKEKHAKEIDTLKEALNYFQELATQKCSELQAAQNTNKQLRQTVQPKKYSVQQGSHQQSSTTSLELETLDGQRPKVQETETLKKQNQYLRSKLQTIQTSQMNSAELRQIKNSEDLDRFRKELEKLASEVSNLYNINRALNETNRECSVTIAELRRQISVLEDNNTQKTQQISDLTLETQQHANEIRRLNEQNFSLRESLQSLEEFYESKIKQETNCFAQSERINQEKYEQFDIVNTSHVQLIRRQERIIAELRAQLREKTRQKFGQD